MGIRSTIVEPGAFRTGWGTSMRLAEVADDYSATVGRVHERRRLTDGRQPGDPARAAQVLREVVASAQPPLRLLLGSDALQLAERSSRARAREAAVWSGVSRSTDFEDAVRHSA